MAKNRYFNEASKTVSVSLPFSLWKQAYERRTNFSELLRVALIKQIKGYEDVYKFIEQFKQDIELLKRENSLLRSRLMYRVEPAIINLEKLDVLRNPNEYKDKKELQEDVWRALGKTEPPKRSDGRLDI